MYKFLIALFSLVLCSGVAADVQLTIKDLTGRMSTISSDGKKARIEGQGMPGYALIDYASNEILMVDLQQKQVMSASLGGQGAAAAGAGLDVSLKDKGGGQKIAGYLTHKYELIANGDSCGTVYASKKLLANREISEMFDAMRRMTLVTRNMMGAMSAMLSVCQRAQMQLADVIGSAGAPLKVIDADGKLQSEVVAVNTRFKVASGYYQLPAGMTVVSVDEKMSQARQQMQQNLPDMNQLLEQLQQGGGQLGEEMQQGGGQVSEEMQQQMDKIKKMLEQLQQQ